MLELRNPHSILAALQVRPKAVKIVHVHSPPQTGDAWDDVVREAGKHGIPVVSGGSSRAAGSGPRQRAGSGGRGPARETERTGGGFASVEPPSPVPLELLLNAAPDPESGSEFGSSGLWLALDQVQDPQNLGAIFRLAGFFGIRGLVLTKDRSAPVNATVCDVAAGGVEFVPFAIVANLAQAIEKSQQHGIWVLGTCERSETPIHRIRRDRHWMLIVGNEGHGLRRLTREKCDQLVAFPSLGPVPSLNVATATAACLAILSSATEP